MMNGDDVRQQKMSEQQIYSEVQRLFTKAVELPEAERVDWAVRQLVADPRITERLVSALQADFESPDYGSEVYGSEVCAEQQDQFHAVTVSSASADTSLNERRRLPVIPNYEVLEEIDRGGMGVVYRARQIRPERIVAIKMMKMGAFSSQKDIQRFLNEANAASRLYHFAVVPIYEVGEFQGEPFITMKFIKGETLSTVLQRNELSTRDAVQKLCVVFQAIANAHDHGIIHRDLKPSNILIEAETGQPWVTDFGLAKSVESGVTLTAAGDIMGTPGYMAPEQAIGDSNRVTPAADVYGLGAILYRVLTGRPPIRSESGDILETLELIKEHDIVAPRRLSRNVPRELNTLCVKSLETDPGLRYQHANEFALDLQRYLDGEAVMARPQTLLRRGQNWARHNPGLAVTLFTVSFLYLWHVYARLLGYVNDDDEFNWAANIVATLAVCNASFWQYWLRRTQNIAVLYAWVTGELLLLTYILLVSSGTNSGLVSAYFILVAVSVLRCRPLLIAYVTLLCEFSYAFVWFYTESVQPGSADPLTCIPVLLTLPILGVVQYIALRRSSGSIESQIFKRT